MASVAAPFVESQVLARRAFAAPKWFYGCTGGRLLRPRRRVFLQQRKPDRSHSFIAAEWIGLIGPVQKTGGPRIAMKMMLGLLVIKQRLRDCGIDHGVHSSGRATNSWVAQLMLGGHVGFYGLEHALPDTESGADGLARGRFSLRLP